MRRRYSEQELTKIVEKVSKDYIDELIEGGEFDDEISDYVDAYLVQHPVDITALNGKDVSCKSVTTTHNVVVGGNLSVSGNITGASIIENMSGYSYHSNSAANVTEVYASIVKNGNKLTLVLSGTLTKGNDTTTEAGYFIIPQSVMDVLVPVTGDYLANGVINLQSSVFNSGFSKPYAIAKYYTRLIIRIFGLNADLDDETTYMFRIEQTFLLSNNFISQE